MGPRFHLLLLLIVKYHYTLLKFLQFLVHIHRTPYLPPPDLTPDWIPNQPVTDFFQFYNIFNSSFTSTRHTTLSRLRLFNFTIASILGTHPSDPTFFQFHNKLNSWIPSDRPTPGPTTISSITPTFSVLQYLQFVVHIHQTSHPTTPDFFQIASILGNWFTSTRPDPPPPPHTHTHLEKDFHK